MISTFVEKSEVESAQESSPLGRVFGFPVGSSLRNPRWVESSESPLGAVFRKGLTDVGIPWGPPVFIADERPFILQAGPSGVPMSEGIGRGHRVDQASGKGIGRGHRMDQASGEAIGRVIGVLFP